jgi:DNA modification methylase
MDPVDKPVHDWYRFILSFPPHLVRHYLDRFKVTPDKRVLDPFCGTGTTLVECMFRGAHALGLEANPVAHFAASVKTDWGVDPDELSARAQDIAVAALTMLSQQGIADDPPPDAGSPRSALRCLPPESEKLLLANSISPLPLHKCLVLLESIGRHKDAPCHNHLLLAFARILVASASNLHFGPEVGVRNPKPDAAVIGPWADAVRRMAADLDLQRDRHPLQPQVLLADARSVGDLLEPGSVDAVITSPPYPNEKDYTRTTRLESVLLGYLTSKEDLRSLKKQMVRSNTRGVYKDDSDDRWVAANAEISSIADAIEARRLELGKDSGFERLYGRVTKLYFGGMARHLAELRKVLRPGAALAYVVGDQASYLQVMIETGRLLADIAQSLGYEVVGRDLFRARFATATRKMLREEVLVLRWNG